METLSAVERYHEAYDEVYREVIFDALASRKTNRQQWKLISAARLIKVWNDYVKMNFVRDVEFIQSCEELLLRNTIQLRINTSCMGHMQCCGIKEAVEDFELNKYQARKLRQRFVEGTYTEDKNGAYMLSDYGLPKLEKLLLQIMQQDSAEQKLLLIDQFLNVVYCRSDLAALFIEGGSKTLTKLSSNEKHNSDCGS